MIKNISKNKIVKNIGWLVVDKLLILFLQFFVGIKIANYYGSGIYGEYSYAMAIVGFSPIILEIINGRVVKEFYEGDFNKTVSSVTTFRNILSIGLFLGAIFSYPFLKTNINLYLMLVLLCFDNVLSTTTAGIESYFEYRLLSKNIVISNNVVKIVSYLLQYVGLIMECSILMIPIIRIVGSFLRMIILKKFYYRAFKEKVKITLDKKLIKILVKDSYYLWVSFIAFVVYTQIDKIMIGKMLGVEEVGIYSIAIQLSGVLAILIGPFQNSIYPKMMELYKKDYFSYEALYLKVNTMFTQIYIVLSILSVIIVKYLFPYIYAKEYSPAILCYGIMAVSIFFKANGALQTGHMTLKRITRKSFYKTLFGLIMNVILNLTLIPKYGINGAAMATSITQVFTIFIVDYFIKDYREQFFIQLKSFNPLNMRGRL
ncbi:MAG: flippase [Fusobacteriaceae bacterium]